MEAGQWAKIRIFMKTVMITLFGFLSLICLNIFVVLNLPIYMYRFLLSKVITPCFRPKIAKIVDFRAAGIATDFLQRNIHISSRNAVLVNITLEGTISMEQVKEKVTSGWLFATDHYGQILYPEFQQYIEFWKGFMFWKQDTNFQLDNHVNLHTLEENATDEDSEKFVWNLIEKLLNKNFIPKRSPWEIQIVHNFKDSILSNKALTMLIIRVHESMTDGPSLMTTVMEGLCGGKVPVINHLPPKSSRQKCGSKRKHLGNMIKIPKYFVRLPYDMGLLVLSVLPKSPLMVSDDKDIYPQLYRRSDLIPIERVEWIKDKYGTSFTSVILSCVSTAVGQVLKNVSTVNENSIIIGIPIPSKVTSGKLGINSASTLIELPVSFDLDPIDRLIKCQHVLRSSMKSRIPLIISIIQRVFLPHLALVARYMTFNHYFPTYITSFPAPVDMNWHGRNKMVGVDFAVGGLAGSAGVGLTALFTNDHLRITLTSECGFMGRDEINEMVNCIEMEIENLYNLEYA